MVLSQQSINVIRYTALGSGILYGFLHNRKLHSQAKIHQAQSEYHRKESLIRQAKAEWAKKQLPAGKKTESGDIISDPNDSRFDLEAFLLHLDEQMAPIV